MPDPGETESKDEFMKRCIPMVLDDGTAKDNDQAVAICMSKWENRGEGGSSDEKSIDNTLITYGGQVKALGGGRIGGYLVRFSTDEDPDLEGEYFTKETDFGDAQTAPVYYQHGLDPKIGKRRIGKATHRIDDFGIWAEAQLDMRDEYERFIYSMAEKGKQAWSSGTAGHLVEREKRGKAVWLKSWPLGLDDTLTPTPAEPRNTALPLKSWQPSELSYTLAERISDETNNIALLTSDLRGFVKSIDRPLSETKRKELNALLESCSGMVAVRDDLQAVLTTAPTPKLVGPRLISHDMAEHRKRLARILQE